jgi:hypothetical protein
MIDEYGLNSETDWRGSSCMGWLPYWSTVGQLRDKPQIITAEKLSRFVHNGRRI